MQKIVELSSGEKVVFRPHFTHDAEVIYRNARDRGVVDREYTEGGEVKIVRERPLINYSDCIHETLLYLIESVEKGESKSKPTSEWLGGLTEPDYNDLADALVAVRAETHEYVAAGKKNS